MNLKIYKSTQKDMSDEPSYERRKSKNDKRAKRRQRVYKKGGKFRSEK